MTIQDLGSIGELIAAIATVATLAYLAVQIRQNTLSNRDANVRTTHDMILRVNSAVIDNPEMADLLLCGSAGPENLDPAESITDDFRTRLGADPTLRFSETVRACGRRGRGGPLNRGA